MPPFCKYSEVEVGLYRLLEAELLATPQPVSATPTDSKSGSVGIASSGH